jgi:hypothetical protein
MINESIENIPPKRLKTILSSLQTSQLNQTPFTEIINSKNNLTKLFNPDSKLFNLDADNMSKGLVNGALSQFNDVGKVSVKIDKRDIKGDGPKGSQIKQLIQLIMGIIKLPKRFMYLFKSFGEAAGAMTLGMGGVFQSAALGAKDIYLLIIAILNIVFKYTLCIISFTVTTIAGCSLLHLITFTFVMIKVAIMYMVDLINRYLKIDFTDIVDAVFEHIKWPGPINMICYSCFGKKVRLRDIISDVGVISDVGNIISQDFKVRMPRYMRPSVPLGKLALKDLDKAIKG